jgi:hypothetical protein
MMRSGHSLQVTLWVGSIALAAAGCELGEDAVTAWGSEENSLAIDQRLAAHGLDEVRIAEDGRVTLARADEIVGEIAVAVAGDTVGVRVVLDGVAGEATWTPESFAFECGDGRLEAAHDATSPAWAQGEGTLSEPCIAPLEVGLHVAERLGHRLPWASPAAPDADEFVAFELCQTYSSWTVGSSCSRCYGYANGEAVSDCYDWVLDSWHCSSGGQTCSAGSVYTSCSVRWCLSSGGGDHMMLQL